jgi:hypothetical protein
MNKDDDHWAYLTGCISVLSSLKQMSLLHRRHLIRGASV